MQRCRRGAPHPLRGGLRLFSLVDSVSPQEEIMGRTVQINVEPLTKAAFRPFGQLISTSNRLPDFTGVNSNGWKAGFEADGPTLVMLLSSRNEGQHFTRLERHFGVTQTFIPLGQVPAV